MLQLRLHSQGLVDRQHASMRAVATALCGVQAQDLSAALLAGRARSGGSTAEGFARELRRRVVVRGWCMRGTMHLVAAEDLRWLVSVCGPGALSRSRRRLRDLGITDRVLAKALTALKEHAGGSGLTRERARSLLEEAGIPSRGQALYHCLRALALGGEIAIVAADDLEDRYVAAAAIGGKAPGEKTPRLEGDLARRYLRAYGPATVEDFAKWSGLRARDARAAWGSIEEDLVELPWEGGTLQRLRDASPVGGPTSEGAVVRLLPAFDPYVLGYGSRELVIDRHHERRLHPGGGVVRPSVLVDGRVKGTWSLRKKGGRAWSLRVQLFGSLSASEMAGLAAEARDIGRFYEGAVDLEVDR